MAKIRILKDEVINKIAAGEVCDRPASLVKELVENSIDSGAKSITIRLVAGGLTEIVIKDDGCGISAQDLALAVTRHGTSKISDIDDLFAIQTMGFRGEALASIAAVSKLRISSREESDANDSGRFIDCEFGEVKLESPYNGTQGTEVKVRDLFANVPARRKFLKSQASEYAKAHEVVQSLALAHPEIHMRLFHNGKEIFDYHEVCTLEGQKDAEPCSLSAIEKRCQQIFAKKNPQLKFQTVEEHNAKFALKGLLAPPGCERGNARHIFTFVNGRLLKDKLLRYAVMRGYHSHLLKGKYPFAVIYIATDPALIDINVHPQKTEVRFQYERELSDFVAMSIRKSLRSGAWASPEGGKNVLSTTLTPDSGIAAFRGATPFGTGKMFGSAKALPQDSLWNDSQRRGETVSQVSRYSAGTNPKSVRGAGEEMRSTASNLDNSSPSDGTLMDMPVTNLKDLDALLKRPCEDFALGQGEEPLFATNPETKVSAIPFFDLTWIGSFAKGYLLFQLQRPDDCWLLAVDQHAFHERIIFERLTSMTSDTAIEAQDLLIPELITLSATEVAAISENTDSLHLQGFAFKTLDCESIEITRVPVLLAAKNLQLLISEIAEHLLNEAPHSTQELARLIFATMACHGAVKVGEDLDQDDLKQLLREASEVDFYHNCPHGRRVFKWMNLREVETWFDRV